MNFLKRLWRGGPIRPGRTLISFLLDSSKGQLIPRWILLRCLGLIYFSAFYSWAFQAHGLIGPQGILPASTFLGEMAKLVPGFTKYLSAPTLLWLSAGNAWISVIITVGAIASMLLTFNLRPRLAAFLCWLTFLSLVAGAQDFSSYQSDSMLLESGLIAIFFAPRGWRPGLGDASPPSRLSAFLLKWQWFRIYFESGVVKLLSGDPQWRTLTAMEKYYETGPFPTWIGWYVQQYPPSFHIGVALATLIIELGVVWLAWFPRAYRIACFLVVSLIQTGILLTANYGFLNYLVLALGVMLLDDRALRWLGRIPRFPLPWPDDHPRPGNPLRARWMRYASSALLATILYSTVAGFLFAGVPLLTWPMVLLAPFRAANSYGLFAVMTRSRYEIEFQGTSDGKTWKPYPFRYKPQDPMEAPGIFAPYQPRFEWNLWFASLGSWDQSPWVVSTEARLLNSEPSVLRLFADNPFPDAPPVKIKTVLWEYRFTDAKTRALTGQWWERKLRGPFSPAVRRKEDGAMELTDWP